MLNGENGLLLTPTIDHLFDRGFIGFQGNGDLIVSPVAHRPSLERMGIDDLARVQVSFRYFWNDSDASKKTAAFSWPK